jgi:hypothetical protein
MPSLLAPADIRQHIETDLADSALQRLIDGEEAEIVRRFGPHTTADETFEVSPWDLAQGGMFPWGYPWGEVFPWGASNWLALGRPAQSITTLTEWIGTVSTVLSATDYAVRAAIRIERLPTGPNPRLGWGHRVEVVYVPADDSARRVRVLINLVQLSLSYTGKKLEKLGDFYGANYDDYQGEREGILSTLRRRIFA